MAAPVRRLAVLLLALCASAEPWAPLVLQAKDVTDILMQEQHGEQLKKHCPGLAADAFEGIRLSTLTGPARHDILVQLARYADELRHPDAVFDAPEETREPLPGRGNFAEPCFEYDWLRTGADGEKRRVVVKSAMMSWRPKDEQWIFTFTGVKLPLTGDLTAIRPEPPFDELLLALYTPRGVYIYKHDLTTGVIAPVGSQVSRLKGHKVLLIARRGNEKDRHSWEAALDKQIIKNLAKAAKGVEDGTPKCPQLAFFNLEPYYSSPLMGRRRLQVAEDCALDETSSDELGEADGEACVLDPCRAWGGPAARPPE